MKNLARPHKKRSSTKKKPQSVDHQHVLREDRRARREKTAQTESKMDGQTKAKTGKSQLSDMVSEGFAKLLQRQNMIKQEDQQQQRSTTNTGHLNQ